MRSGPDAPVVFIAGNGSDTFTGGTGDDFWQTTAADLDATDTFAGGAISPQVMTAACAEGRNAGYHGSDRYIRSPEREDW